MDKKTMDNQEFSVGLDIGTTKIVAMIGTRNEFNKTEILGVGRADSLGVKRGVVNNIAQTIHSIQKAAEAAEKDSGQKIDCVTVGVAGQHIRSLQHSDYITRTDPESVITHEDIDRLCKQVHKLAMLPGEEIIHVLPQEFKVDGQCDITEPIGMAGARLEANFHVVVGNVSAIKNIYRCVKSAGLNLSEITLEPLASADAVLSQDEKDAGVALVDIGGGTTDVAIFKDNIIRHTAVIPFGGNVITEDIKEACSIIDKQAELLKVKFGSAWPGENRDSEIVAIPGLRGRDPKEISLKNLSKIIHARVKEIIELVHQEIRNYGHDQPKKQLIAGIVLTGGGSQLRHIKQLTEFITGMDTRVGYPNEHLAGDTDEGTSTPAYATAVGLVMKGLEGKTYAEITEPKEQAQSVEAPEAASAPEQQSEVESSDQQEVKKSSGIFERWTEKIKNFLETVE